MTSGSAGSILSALFIDYDNVYLSLRNRNLDAATQFARNPSTWLSRMMNGGLIQGAGDQDRPIYRRLGVARCYGNPIPWRQGRNGPEDPNCFARVRHHFMRAGMEIVDCPKITSQFKNASDIRMACDIRDYLDHPVKYDEFIILSSDSDFTPVLLNLRAFDRRRVIYTNESTSPYYRAFCDGWIEEQSFIQGLLQPIPLSSSEAPQAIGFEEDASDIALGFMPRPALQSPAAETGDVLKRRSAYAGDGAVQSLIADFKVISKEITQLVVEIVENSAKAVPLAYLADRAQKTIGQPKTVGTNWAGSGGFLNFLQQNLPQHLKISERPPQAVYNPAKHKAPEDARDHEIKLKAQTMAPPSSPAQSSSEKLGELQQSITRIYSACQAPPLPPSEYQLLFTLIAAEVRDHGFQPHHTAKAVVSRAKDAGLKLSLNDVTFVLGAVDEIDPWLERTQSAAAVARAYRDYVLRRCQAAGLTLTDDEHQLIQVWFGASQWGQSSNDKSGTTSPAVHPRQANPVRLTAFNDRGFAGGNNRSNDHNSHGVEKNDIPLPPDFGFGIEPEDENPFELSPLTAVRFNFPKKN